MVVVLVDDCPEQNQISRVLTFFLLYSKRVNRAGDSNINVQ